MIFIHNGCAGLCIDLKNHTSALEDGIFPPFPRYAKIYSSRALFGMSVSVLFQFKYGAMNIYGRHGNYLVDFQGYYKVAGKLKGPLI
jgi:hypothetical protein